MWGAAPQITPPQRDPGGSPFPGTVRYGPQIELVTECYRSTKEATYLGFYCNFFGIETAFFGKLGSIHGGLQMVGIIKPRSEWVFSP
jgi:hypothetical protein